jgi:predicted MFS family arabinose efflux permease
MQDPIKIEGSGAQATPTGSAAVSAESVQVPPPESSAPGGRSDINRQAWAPLSIPAYRTFWIAGLFSNMGTWMHETGAQWLMASLEPRPEMVSAVRTAMTIPVFCLALPAGVWADRFNRRTWLLSSQLLLLLIAMLMACLAAMGWLTPGWLLVFSAAMGIGMILNQPAWQALTPELVPPAMVPAAVAIGSVSFNLARALGPVLAGIIIAQFGVWATFSMNALSFLAVIAALLVWSPQIEDSSSRSSPEFMPELRKGIFVVSNSAPLRNALLRVLVFAFSASILWSLLALVATQQLGFQERGFGVCLGLIGVGAVAAAWFLPWARQQFSSEVIVLVGQILFAGVLLTLGVSGAAWLILPALLLVGGCWMAVMTTLNATAQVYLPRKFRARGMAAYLMAFSLGMALGSLVWGWLAWGHSLNLAFCVAAGVLVSSAAAMHRLQIGSLNVEA